MIYLDNAATTKINQDVVKAMEPFLNKEYGNPSGIYQLGKNAKEKIEEAREKIASCINCKKENIFFTSGGTESDNWALSIGKATGKNILTSKIEHHAILNKCKELEKNGTKVIYVDNDEKGNINIDNFEQKINNNVGMVSIMMANNEIGTILNTEEIGKITKNHRVLFHCDGVQGVGHIPVDVDKINVDLLSASGHKFSGPKGVGFLYIRNPQIVNPFIYGGGQEKDKRGGTENVASIVGMGEALYLACNNLKYRMDKEIKLRDYALKRILWEIPNCHLNGEEKNRLPSNINISIDGVDGTSLVVLMDNDGVCISAGSACSAGKEEPSHVIMALEKTKEQAYSTIRLSLSFENIYEEIDYAISMLKKNIMELRKNS